ncbi:hypothetical protein CBER1_07579 [Cercospora berteroae]|uniref:Uncharacterized protein n=1 Tax=Cercospora berteroae TaxID=357750 RepID=A0A2S6CK01_9PEZI|nr:hypothetical protein CBER1_07579 [Cercospora berteroae]
MIFALSSANWRLDYSTYTVSEMRKFLKDRAGTTLAQKSDKGALVKDLKTVDRSTTVTLVTYHIFVYGTIVVKCIPASFHTPQSTDLPLDIRLLVYEHLAFHPQILATSKSTYQEAKDVLSRLVTSVKLNTSTSSSLTVQPKIQVNGGTWTTLPLVPTSIGGLTKSLAAWPVIVTSASQIRLYLHLDTSSILETSYMLYLLATLLADGKKREIQVHVDYSDDWSQRRQKKLLFQALYPLTRMGKNVRVTIVNLPRETLKALGKKKRYKPECGSSKERDYQLRPIIKNYIMLGK